MFVITTFDITKLENRSNNFQRKISKSYFFSTMDCVRLLKGHFIIWLHSTFRSTEKTFNGLIFSNKTVKTEAEQPQRCHRTVLSAFEVVAGKATCVTLARSNVANGNELDEKELLIFTRLLHAANRFYNIHISLEMSFAE